MAEPREHLPKLAALDAYRRDRLSSSARVRIERHLQTCDVCREALSGARRFALLMADVDAAHAPELDWSRIELPLHRAGSRLRMRTQLRRFGGALLLATAAAAAALIMNQRAVPRAPAPRAEAPARVIAPEPAALSTRVMAIAGSVVAVDRDGRRSELDLNAEPREGWTLETAAQSELHLALEDTATLIVPGGSKLTLQRLRANAVEIELLAGEVINHVAKRAPDESYEVRADGRRVAVRGTRFSVELGALGLSVQVDEGAVVVLGADDQTIAELSAPARWSSGGNGTITRSLRRPLEGGTASESWPTLELPSWPHVDIWTLRDAELSAHTELKMRAPAGDIDILAQLDDGRRLTARMHLDALGGRFDPRTLRSVAGRVVATQGPASLDPQQISTVIHEGQTALQRCYERTLRDQQSALSGSLRVRLRLSLDSRGRVQQVDWLRTPETPQIPALLKDCVGRVATGWKFPAPGGAGAAFEAPISFRPAR